MENKTQENTRGGNTITPLVRCRKWVFVLNNYDEMEYNTILNYVKHKNTTFYIIGKEVGELGTHHLQGYFHAQNAVSFKTLKTINNRWHIQKAKGSDEENLIYCSKENNYITNIIPAYEENLEGEILLEKNLYTWQKEILYIIRNEKPNDRKVNWFVDYEGGKGKSQFCKFLFFHKLANIIKGGKASDIKNLLLTSKNSRDIIFDFSRSTENEYVSYTCIEELKDGYLYSTKYEGGCKLIATPHIFVFSNFEPKREKLSSDRWNIIYM